MIEAMGVDALIAVDLQPPGEGQIEVRGAEARQCATVDSPHPFHLPFI